MLMNFNGMLENAQRENLNAESSSNSNNPYKMFYMFNNGTVKIRLLYNMGIGGVQRMLIRHPSPDGKTKVACMQDYGESCPICEAVNSIQNARGKECGVFRKYGYQKKGICYAQIVSHTVGSFSSDQEKEIKDGDVVVFMYPKSVYDSLNKLFVSVGQNIDKLLQNNEGLPITITRTVENNFPKYDVQLDAFTPIRTCQTDEQFEDLLSKLPSLGEAFISNKVTEEIRQNNRAVAEAINREFLSNNIVNPTTAWNNTVSQAPMMPTVPFNPTMVNANNIIPNPMPTANPTMVMPNAQPTMPMNTFANNVVQTASAEATVPPFDTNGSLPFTLGDDNDKPNCWGKADEKNPKCLSCSQFGNCFIATA